MLDQRAVVAECGLGGKLDELMARAKAAGHDARRRDGARRLDHDVRLRRGHAHEPLPGRVAPLPHAHARRAARRPPSAPLHLGAWPPDRTDHRPRARGGRLGPGTAARRRRRGAPPSTRCSTRRSAAPTPSPRRTPARSPSSTAPGLVAAMRELEALQELVGRAGVLRGAGLLGRHGRPAARRAAAARAGARHRDRDGAAVLRAGVGGARRRRTPRRCWPPTGWTSPATTCAPRAATGRTCCPSPRRRSSPRSRSPAARVDAAVRGAGGRRSRSTCPARRSRSRSTPRSRACSRPTARCGATTAEAVTAGAGARACACAPTSSTRCSPTRWSTTGCAATRTGWRARNLANEASDESVAGAGRGGARPLRAARAAGTASRRGCSAWTGSPTTTAWRPSTDDDEHIPWARRQRSSCSTPTTPSRPSWRHRRGRFFDEPRIDAPVRPGKRGGAFCSYTVPSAAPVRDAQLHRRAGATC